MRSFIKSDWPGEGSLWVADSRLQSIYGDFEITILTRKDEPPSEFAIDRSAALADFARINMEFIVDVTFAYFQLVRRNWGEEVFRITEIPVSEYTRSNVLHRATSRSLSVVCGLQESEIIWSGISLGLAYDEEHGLGMEFDGSDIVSLDGERFTLVDGKLKIGGSD